MQRIFVLSFFIVFSMVGIHAQATIQTVDQYIQLGLINSPLLKDYQNQISAATLDSLLIRAGQRPKVDAGAQILYAPVYRMFGYDDAITNGGNYAGVIGVSQYFLNGRDLRNRFESAAIQKHALANATKISASDLKRLIINQYLSAYADFSNLSFNRRFLKLLEDEKGIIHKLAENGIYKQTDYLSLLLEAQSQEIIIDQMSIQYERDVHTLNQLCGINDSVTTELVLPEISRKPVPDPALSPLFMQYRIDSLKIENDKKAVDVRYLPRLNWFADAGIMSSVPNMIFKHFGTSFGVNFSIPIYDGKQRRLEYQKLDFTEDTRHNYENYFRKQYNQQMLQLDAEQKASEKTLARLSLQLKTAEELINMIKAQLETGNISIVDFINATRNYQGINRDIIQNQITILQTTNEINYLLQE